jgi:RNA polymerase sigma-70 factor (ECF subfamily)
MDESEDTLIRRCRAGEKEAFGVLVRRYAARAVGSAFVLLRNHADAMDASQEAFIRAWRRIRRFEGRASFYTWYSAILRNLCAGVLRRRSAARSRRPAEGHSAPAAEPEPSLLVEQNERARRIWRAVLDLPLKRREAIVMHHFQEMSYRQIADALGIPIGTVMSRLHNARTALREKLAGDRP